MYLIHSTEVMEIANMCKNCECAKLRKTLQEIKAIAKNAIAKQQEYKKDFEQILDLITKAESEG